MINPLEMERAAVGLREYLSPTRLLGSPSLSAESGAVVFLKLESDCPTGSFKVRGALWSILERRKRGPLPGVITSSTGNHGAAVAYASSLLGIPAVIFLPLNPNPAKRALIAAFGAQIVEAGGDLEESRVHAQRKSQELRWPLIVDGQDPEIVCGASVIGSEIMAQLPEADVIYVPVGDSSLIRGVAAAVKYRKPGAQVIGVQAAGAPAYYRAFHERRGMETEAARTIADGLATRNAEEENVRELRELVAEMRIVSDAEMLRAIRRLLLNEHVLAEPAGAAATAAFLKSGREHEGRTVALLVTGANISLSILRSAIDDE